MPVRVIATVTPEELGIHRTLTARQNSIASRPEVFSRQEIEEHYLKLWSFSADLIRKYNIDDREDWGVSVFTGIVFYGE